MIDSENLTPEDRLAEVASLLAAAILLMRQTSSPISENLSTVSNTCLDVVSESLLNVTRGEVESQGSHKRQLTRGN